MSHIAEVTTVSQIVSIYGVASLDTEKSGVSTSESPTFPTLAAYTTVLDPQVEYVAVAFCKRE